MRTSTWLFVLVAVAACAGALYYYERHYTLVREVTTPAPSASPVIVVQPSPSKDELNRKRVEGIGSVKDLKPVPLPSGAAGGDNK
jgi:hypothetical protein